MNNIKKIADKIQKDWMGPDGKIWCKDKKEFVNPEKCDCEGCQAIDITDQHPSKYLRPTDISW
jgi:hypothetical protein